MKELKEHKYHSDKFDIDINRYLTYAQIQQIANAVRKMETWSERQQASDMLLLYHVTNIGKEELEKLGHDVLLQSGLIDEVKEIVENCHDIYNAIQYEESIEKSLTKIVKELPKIMEPLEKVMNKHGNAVQK